MRSAQALGLTTVNGLPAHILIVHAVVVFVPLTAIYIIAASVRPRLVLRAGLLGPALAAVAFLSVLAAMNAGGWLQNHVANTALVRKHTSMAGNLWPLSLAMLIISVVIYARHHRGPGRLQRMNRMMPVGGATASVVIAVLAIAVGVTGVVETVRIGDSGARAAWHGHFTAKR